MSSYLWKNFLKLFPTSRFPIFRFFSPFYSSYMDKLLQNQPKIQDDEEVNSIEWEFVDMNEQEEDIISRMHNLVGDKWALIAGRVPDRKPEEIERYWLMKNNGSFIKSS